MVGREPHEVEALMTAAGLGADDVRAWLEASAVFNSEGAEPCASFAIERGTASRYWTLGNALLGRLPSKPQRTAQEHAAAETIKDASREIRVRFMRAWANRVYLDLTGQFGEYVRVDDLVYRAAERFPGLTPTREAVAAERQHLQRDKDGIEIDQGIFLSSILADRYAGTHLCWAMLRPRADSLERLTELRQTGFVDLVAASVRRVGRVGHVLMRNTRYLNAEDDSTLAGLEMAVDLATLDPEIDVVILRGAPVEHPRYAGRHVFSAGINLTHLYQGQISYLFYLLRDLGPVNKMYRGLTAPDFLPDEPETTLEKPWIAAVEAFAIGGGCQILLVMDQILAEQDAFFNLPARKEGIIPGVANLRLPRFVGDRLARQGILFDRQFPADSPEGRLLCDRVVPTGEMDAAIDDAVQQLTGSGVVSAAGNRKALRIGQEPLDLFRTYMATYAREQAHCHFSPALIDNLERHWTARQRKP